MAAHDSLDKSIRDSLDRLENLVVGASHFPFTERTLVNDNDLIHYVGELRRDVPAALDAAQSVLNERDGIIAKAEREADDMRKKAEEYARRVTDEQEIMQQAREQARTIVEQAQAQAQEILEVTQKNASDLQLNADNYANQVFDQLINHVNGTFTGVRQAEAGLQQALNVLTQAKQQMNNQAAQQQQIAQEQARELAATQQQREEAARQRQAQAAQLEARQPAQLPQ